MASYFLFNAFIRTSEQSLGVAAFSKQIWPWEGIFHSNNFLHNNETFFLNIAGVLFRNHRILVPTKMKTIYQPFANGFAHFQNLQPKAERTFHKGMWHLKQLLLPSLQTLHYSQTCCKGVVTCFGLCHAQPLYWKCDCALSTFDFLGIVRQKIHSSLHKGSWSCTYVLHYCYGQKTYGQTTSQWTALHWSLAQFKGQ